MTETTTTKTPSIHLFTYVQHSNDHHHTDNENETVRLTQLHQDFLQKMGHDNFPETNLAEDNDLYMKLRKRFPNMTFPGILLDDIVWVHGSDGRELQAAWSKAWFDHVWHGQESYHNENHHPHKTSTQNDHPNQTKNEGNEEESIDVPLPISLTQSLPNSIMEPSLTLLQQQFGDSLRSANSNNTSLYTSPSSSSQLANVTLPNGTHVDMGALIRLLMRATHHNTAEREGNKFFYFRGFEGLELWSILFFEDHHADVTEFGRMLIELGIVHNYTPKCTDFSKTFLVLQPLKEPRVLNSFVKWPTGKNNTATSCSPDDEATDPMDVLLRLSRLMDEICATDYREHLHLYHEFEIGCCQLQVLPFPSDQRERVTFLLNLYNMAVRHAVICCDERHWSWPTNLADLHAFFSKTGYNIDGTWVSLAELQAVLYGNTETVMPTLTSEPIGFWKRWSLCRPGDAIADSSQYYSSSAIRTDPRLLFAMTLGVKGSPSVATVYPHRLEEALQTATEIYMRERVIISDSGVVLPALASWFRHDLGDGTAKMALHYMLPFLSVNQMRILDELWQCGIFDIEFGIHEDDWKQGLITLSEAATAPTATSSKSENQTCSKSENQTCSKLENQEVPPKEASTIDREITSLNPYLKKEKSFRKHPTVEEFSIPPAPELIDQVSDLIDPAPLLSPPSLASKQSSKIRGSRSVASKSASHKMPSLPQNKPGTLLRRLWGRYPSVGDFAPRRPGLLDNTETYYDNFDEDEDALSDDGHSFFQSVVSEITYGSEFQDLLSRRSKRRLQVRGHP